MFFRTRVRCFMHLVRDVDPNGFVGDFRKLQQVSHPETRKQVLAAIKAEANVLICGHYHTGKLTLLRAIGEHCEEKLGLRVAYVSADNHRANRLGGYLVHHFIGLRMGPDELPSREQLEGTLERHVRLVESTYAGALPSLSSADVLILDAMEKVAPVVLLAMDAVARRQRGKPDEAFGGLRVFGSADFWRLPVHPTSDTGGYVYQSTAWPTLFPKRVVLEKTHGQDPVLNAFTVKAFYGNLSMNEICELEELSIAGKPQAAQFAGSRSGRPLADRDDLMGDDADTEIDNDEVVFNDTMEEEEDHNADEEDAEGRETPTTKSDPPISASRGIAAGAAVEADASATLNDDVTSNADALVRFTVRFPKQPAVRVMPPKYRQLKQTEVGNFLVNMLVQSLVPTSLGLVDNLSVEVGARVHLLLDGTVSCGVPGGAVGEVMAVKEHVITVYFPAERRTVDIARMRVTIYHPLYPEVRYEVRQFPLYPRERLSPSAILSFPNCFRVNLNGRRLADTNDLGNLLAHMRTFDDFTLRNTADFAYLDGVVHEPTRIYYSELLGRQLGSAAEQWCRNCKSFVLAKGFFDHWATCVQTVRWCNECGKTIPVELLEPHREKHQTVLCMDCGQAVEWRRWESHRLSCPAMMRELSADNEFLPLRTRQLALELGLDKRDLHTMKSFSRSMLPKASRPA